MTNKIEIFLVEDDAIIRATLKLILEKKGFEIVGEADEAPEAFKLIKEIKPDLAILDVNLMSEEDGIWLANQIRESLVLPIIFITAFNDEHTLQRIMTTRPNGFLTKPFKEVEVVSAVFIAISNFEQNNQAALPSKNEALPEAGVVAHDFLFIKEKNTLVKVHIDKIYFLKSDGNYVEIILNERKYLVREKLSALAEKLLTKKFVQVHQRYLVCIDKIDKIGNGFLMVGSERIPVSKAYYKSLYNIYP